MKVRRSSCRLEIVLFCLCLGISLAGGQGVPGGDDGHAADVGVRGVIIPIGFEQGQYSALVQVIADGSPLPGAAWELRASPVVGIKNNETISGSIAVAEANIPAVLETQMNLLPGQYELELNALETTGGQTGAGQLKGLLPNPDLQSITISPVAIVQPAEAAFLRDGNSRSRGALGRAVDEPVLADLPTAMVCLVCRGLGRLDEVRVERKLSGATSMDFNPIQLQLGEERCAQIRDLIQPGVMTDGFFRYEVRVFDEHAQRASGHRAFTTVTPGAAK
jgi:hypothetical protein